MQRRTELLPLLDATAGQHQVLVATPSNEPTDVVAAAIHRRLASDARYAGKMVIRYHSSDTERDVIWSHARKGRGPSTEAVVPVIDDSLVTSEVAALEAAMLLRRHYDHHTSALHLAAAGISDPMFACPPPTDQSGLIVSLRHPRQRTRDAR
jgi:hypothetical protein